MVRKGKWAETKCNKVQSRPGFWWPPKFVAEALNVVSYQISPAPAIPAGHSPWSYAHLNPLVSEWMNPPRRTSLPINQRIKWLPKLIIPMLHSRKEGDSSRITSGTRASPRSLEPERNRQNEIRENTRHGRNQELSNRSTFSAPINAKAPMKRVLTKGDWIKQTRETDRT